MNIKNNRNIILKLLNKKTIEKKDLEENSKRINIYNASMDNVRLHRSKTSRLIGQRNSNLGKSLDYKDIFRNVSVKPNYKGLTSFQRRKLKKILRG